MWLSYKKALEYITEKGFPEKKLIKGVNKGLIVIRVDSGVMYISQKSLENYVKEYLLIQ